jgi:hypothetical protein
MVGILQASGIFLLKSRGDRSLKPKRSEGTLFAFFVQQQGMGPSEAG